MERIADHLLLGDDCWEWEGSTVDGYGRVRDDVSRGGRLILVHRAVFRHFFGEIPEGQEVDHRCHDPKECPERGPECPHRRCARPDHLKAVTRPENIQRSGVSGLRPYCGKGLHAMTPDNIYWSRGGTKRACKACHRISQDRRRKKAEL